MILLPFTNLPMLGPLLKLGSSSRTVSRVFLTRHEWRCSSSPESWLGNLISTVAPHSALCFFQQKPHHLLAFVFHFLLRPFSHLLVVLAHFLTTCFFHYPYNLLTVLLLFFVILTRMVKFIHNIQQAYVPNSIARGVFSLSHNLLANPVELHDKGNQALCSFIALSFALFLPDLLVAPLTWPSPSFISSTKFLFVRYFLDTSSGISSAISLANLNRSSSTTY